jgi:hypothetical protein
MQFFLESDKNKMITNFSKYTAPLAKYIAAPLAMLALAGCGAFSEDKIREPNEQEYQTGSYVALLNDKTENKWGRNLFVVDEDGDGNVDVMQFMGVAHWVAKGYTPREYEFREGFTKTMTPEIQAAATRELQAEKDLAFLIHQENYRLQQEKQK